MVDVRVLLQVLLSHLSNMGSTEEASQGIVQFVKERDVARDEMKKAQDELTVTQSKLYDAMQKIEALEKVRNAPLWNHEKTGLRGIKAQIELLS